jgi:peptide/nickel transport system ATP-binding protein
MDSLLHINNLTVDFVSEQGHVAALKKLSLSIHAGEIVALVGESGSGKSVTALSLLQLLPVPPAIYQSGEIWFQEPHTQLPVNLLTLTKKALQNIRGNKIAMVFQEPMSALNPVITCGEQVAEIVRIHQQLSKKAAKEKVIHWFEKVKLPSPIEMYNRYPHQLSGGQKQRVMLAMAMCCNPALLICDEPTTALDVTVQKTILELIKELQQQTGMAVLFITHDLGVVAQIADRALVMYKGEIVEQNSVTNILKHPQHPYTKALIACRPLHHQRGKRLPVVSDFLGPKMDSSAHTVESNVLQTIEESVTVSSSTATLAIPKQKTNNVLLAVNNLSVWFGTQKNFWGSPRAYVKAVDAVSFQLHQGETLGLVGESGCGKSTLGRALLKLINPTHGSIIYNGKDITHQKGGQLLHLRKEVQLIFQDPYASLNARLTIGQAIAEPMLVHAIETNATRRKERTIALLEKVGLSAAHYNRYPHEFSGGQRQRIVMARALAVNPSFIVCDESVSALDVSVQAQVLNLLNDLKKEFGFTTIFISHDLSVVRYLSDRIMVMNKGKIVEIGPADEVYYRPSNAYTKALIAAIPQ